jgi:hypothetical protein
MMFKFTVCYFLLSLLLISCTSERKEVYSLSIGQQHVLPHLSSGSGIVLYHEKVFVISDNMNGFFSMDTNNLMQRFYSFDGDSAFIRAKDNKEDFESASPLLINGEQQIVALASGSIDSSRQKLLMFSANDPSKHTIINAAWLYDAIKQKMGITSSSLNIEAAFSTADSLYLLNRGTNQSVAISIAGFRRNTEPGADAPVSLSVQSFKLPMLDSFPVAFSGACYYKEDKFLFTASVEKTNNWVADGEVAGSYIGMAKVDGSILCLLPLKDEKGNMILQKLESLDITQQYANGDIALFAISDNDNGQSTWFRLRLHRK